MQKAALFHKGQGTGDFDGWFYGRLWESKSEKAIASFAESKSQKAITSNGTDMHTEFVPSPLVTDMDFLTQKINQETPEFGEAHPFAFFVRNEKNQIIAGCNGSVLFGSIHTEQLWVHPHHRQNGLGHQLMESDHDYGRKSGCSMATVATMSFQSAELFYKKLGYVKDFERRGYVKNSGFLFMRKEL
jgi:GNAT superfamily N-acetyltransferase